MVILFKGSLCNGVEIVLLRNGDNIIILAIEPDVVLQVNVIQTIFRLFNEIYAWLAELMECFHARPFIFNKAGYS